MSGLIAVTVATFGLLAGAAGAVGASGDASQGERLFKRACATCHSAAKDGAKRIGPTLFGVVGRKSGAVEGFRYSDALRGADLIWTPDTLDAYVADPRRTIPGTLMSFAGLRQAEDRRHLIAYLATLR